MATPKFPKGSEGEAARVGRLINAHAIRCAGDLEKHMSRMDATAVVSLLLLQSAACSAIAAGADESAFVDSARDWYQEEKSHA